jgi:hypothetical protein
MSGHAAAPFRGLNPSPNVMTSEVRQSCEVSILRRGEGKADRKNISPHERGSPLDSTTIVIAALELATIAIVASVIPGLRARRMSVPRLAKLSTMSPADARIIREPTTRSDLRTLAEARFGDMVKAVVDVSRRIMAAGGELHSDEEALLIEDGSAQGDLWGINLYPGESGDDWLEFDSMINVRPSQGNRGRDVEDTTMRDTIRAVVRHLVCDA